MFQTSAPCSPGLVMLGHWWCQWPEPGFAWEICQAAFLKATEAQKDSKSLVGSGRLSLPGEGDAHLACPRSPPTCSPSCLTRPLLGVQASAPPVSHNAPQVLRITTRMSLVHGPSVFRVCPSSGLGCPPVYSPHRDISRQAPTVSSHQHPNRHPDCLR